MRHHQKGIDLTNRQLELYDTLEMTAFLFGLLNSIVDNQITQPQAITELYDTTIPPNLQQAITNRVTPRTGGGGASR